MKKKRDMKYPNMNSLNQVTDVINEASAALNGKNRRHKYSAIYDWIVSITGLLLGIVISYVLLYFLGTLGLSAVGITTGLATLGLVLSIITRGIFSPMLAGIFTIGIILLLPTIVPTLLYIKCRSKKLHREKEQLFKEALQKHEAIIMALKDEAATSKERIDYLQSLNILLQRAIKDLGKDLGVTA